MFMKLGNRNKDNTHTNNYFEIAVNSVENSNLLKFLSLKKYPSCYKLQKKQIKVCITEFSVVRAFKKLRV